MARTPSGQPPANATQTYSSTKSSAPRCPRSCKALIEPLNAAGAHSRAVLGRRCSAAGGCRPRRCRRMATPTAASPTTVRGPARPGRRGRFWMRFVAVLSHWLLVRASTRNGRSMPFRCAFCFLAVRFALACAIFCAFVCLSARRQGMGAHPFVGASLLAIHARKLGCAAWHSLAAGLQRRTGPVGALCFRVQASCAHRSGRLRRTPRGCGTCT